MNAARADGGRLATAGSLHSDWPRQSGGGASGEDSSERERASGQVIKLRGVVTSAVQQQQQQQQAPVDRRARGGRRGSRLTGADISANQLSERQQARLSTPDARALPPLSSSSPLSSRQLPTSGIINNNKLDDDDDDRKQAQHLENSKQSRACRVCHGEILQVAKQAESAELPLTAGADSNQPSLETDARLVHQSWPCERCRVAERAASPITLAANAAESRQQDSLEEAEANLTNNLFWKFLSNLPKSITQRSKSIASSSLAPEVAGYLASKQQLHQQQQEVVDKPTGADDIGRCEGGREEEGEASMSSAEAVVATVTGGMTSYYVAKAFEKRKQKRATPASMSVEQQAAQDGQRLVHIVEPSVVVAATTTPATTTTTSNEAPAAGQPLMGPPDGEGGKRPDQIKLSIATTCTTTRSSASSLSSCILSDSTSTSEVRLKWGKKMDFLLSIIGFAVDLANIWRFPYLVYKNGGGVFLIPYLTMLVFGGIPLFFLELCLGQFVKKGPITVWNKICPSMKGVGYCSILISWYVSFYYNVLIAWSVYFIYRSLLSFGNKMPWEDCDNSWNTPNTCVSISVLKDRCSLRNMTLEACRKDMFSNSTSATTSPASEFFVKELSQIDQSSGLDDMGYLRIELVICTIIVYLLHYFSLFRGLETSGKVVWVTATAPYMILSILLVRGLFLPGASMGIEYYLSPKLEKLADPQVWIDAAGQVFYSIGVGFGVHLTYASFNSHNNNCYRDCLMTSAVNAATSVYSGLVVFVYLGYMAKNLGIEIDKVASEGYSLVFEVYPEALTTLPFARFWSILFFIMLLTLGIDSAMGGLEAVITGLEDEFKFAKRLSRGQLTGLVIVSSFLPALISCTQGGAYTLFWFDIYSAGVSLLFSALFETIGVVYCYGLNKFIPNIESMLGRKPHLFYILCWKYISPIFLGGVIFMSIYTASTPVYRGYTFPRWSVILGWCLAFSSVSAIPIVAIWHWCSNSWCGPMVTSGEKRKRDRGSSSAASSRKSPNHRSVLVSYSGKAPSGLTKTTTTILTTPH